MQYLTCRFVPRRALALALLLCGVTAGRAAEAPAGAGEAVARIAAAEGAAAPGQLTLAVREWRGGFKPGESQVDRDKRLAADKALEAAGTLLYSPAHGWLKDLTVTSASGAATHSRTAECDGLLRFLVEGSINGKPQKIGRVNTLTTTAPADAVLSRRVAKALQGVQWAFASQEGELLTLQGTRGTEKHVVIVRRGGGSPARDQVVSWDLTRFLVSPTGQSVEQSTSCRVTVGEGGAVSRVEEWVVNRPPLSNVAHRITKVRKDEPQPGFKPADLVIAFPAGTLVTDARGEVPVEYEQTAAGIRDEDVAKTATALAQGRAKEGDPAPPLEARDLKGGLIRLSDFPGKIVVLYWFSTRSARAEEMARALRELHDSYRNRGVQFVGLDIAEEGDAARKAESFRKRARWSFPVGVDADGEAMRRYGPEAGVPKVAIVDADGKLAYVRPGFDPDEVTAKLDRVMKGAGK